MANGRRLPDSQRDGLRRQVLGTDSVTDMNCYSPFASNYRFKPYPVSDRSVEEVGHLSGKFPCLTFEVNQ